MPQRALTPGSPLRPTGSPHFGPPGVPTFTHWVLFQVSLSSFPAGMRSRHGGEKGAEVVKTDVVRWLWWDMARGAGGRATWDSCVELRIQDTRKDF